MQGKTQDELVRQKSANSSAFMEMIAIIPDGRPSAIGTGHFLARQTIPVKTDAVIFNEYFPPLGIAVPTFGRLAVSLDHAP